MKILRHKLHQDDGEPVPIERTPNRGGELDPRFLVIHYTAGPNLDSSVRWLCRREARASAHLCIGRDGRIVQLAPFNRVTWHAGISRWNGIQGLNRHSIGIELSNAGRLTQQGEGEWTSWFGRSYPENEVTVATHKHEAEPSGWHTFTPEQIEATLEVSALLVDHYELDDVLGHDDISPGRKADPGPAFPLASLRGRLLGREESEPKTLETTTHLNIRTGPGTEFERLEGSPLAPGVAVEVVEEAAEWRLVDVLSGNDGPSDLQGWVHGRFLREGS